MDVGIVIPHEIIAIDRIEPHLLKMCVDLVLSRREVTTEWILLLTSREKDQIKHCKLGGEPAVQIMEASWCDHRECLKYLGNALANAILRVCWFWCQGYPAILWLTSCCYWRFTHGQYEGHKRYFWLKEDGFKTIINQTCSCHEEDCSVNFAVYGQREETPYAFGRPGPLDLWKEWWFQLCW